MKTIWSCLNIILKLCYIMRLRCINDPGDQTQTRMIGPQPHQTNIYCLMKRRKIHQDTSTMDSLDNKFCACGWDVWDHRPIRGDNIQNKFHIKHSSIQF